MARTYLGYTLVAANADLDALARGSSAWVNVTKSPYLADNTGATSATGAIQTALDALAAVGGGVCYLPRGTYRIGALTVDDTIAVIGDGKGVTVLNVPTLGASASAITSTGTNPQFRDFSLAGPLEGVFVSEEVGIHFAGTSGSPLTGGLVERVEVSGFGSYGILAEYAHGVRVERCDVHDCGYAGIASFSANDFTVIDNDVDTMTPGTAANAYGIFVSERSGEDVPTGFRIALNRVKNVLIWEGIDTHGGTDGVIEGNIITDCAIGINVSPGADNTAPHRVVVNGNTINATAALTTPLRAIGSGGHDGGEKAVGIVCTNNTIRGMGWALAAEGAVLWQETIGLICNNNTVTSARQNGFVFADCLGMTFNGNVVNGVTNLTSNSTAVRFNVTCSGSVSNNWLDAGDNYPVNFNQACPNLRWDDTNVLVTSGSLPASGTLALNPANAGRGYTRQGSATYNPPSLLTLEQATTTVTANGCAIGDAVVVGFSLDLLGLTVTGYVSATNTVTVVLFNGTSGTVNVAEGTLTVRTTRT